MGVTTTNCSCGWKTPPIWKFQGKSGNRQSNFFGKKYAHFISFLNSLQYRLERKNTSLVSFRLHKKIQAWFLSLKLLSYSTDFVYILNYMHRNYTSHSCCYFLFFLIIYWPIYAKCHKMHLTTLPAII